MPPRRNDEVRQLYHKVSGKTNVYVYKGIVDGYNTPYRCRYSFFSPFSSVNIFRGNDGVSKRIDVYGVGSDEKRHIKS